VGELAAVERLAIIGLLVLIAEAGAHTEAGWYAEIASTAAFLAAPISTLQSPATGLSVVWRRLKTQGQFRVYENRRCTFVEPICPRCQDAGAAQRPAWLTLGMLALPKKHGVFLFAYREIYQFACHQG